MKKELIGAKAMLEMLAYDIQNKGLGRPNVQTIRDYKIDLDRFEKYVKKFEQKESE